METLSACEGEIQKREKKAHIERQTDREGHRHTNRKADRQTDR